MSTVPATVAIDLGTDSLAALVVTDHGRWLVPDPATGEPRWASAVHRDAQHILTAVRAQAQRQFGPLHRAVIAIPTGLTGAEPRRALVAAAEAAGFAAVELVLAAVGATWAPGSPVGVGETVLVHDLGATFEATVLRVGDDLPEVLATAAILDWPPDTAPTTAIDMTIACCRELLAAANAQWVLPVGGGARMPGLVPALEDALGRPVARLAEPELAVVRGIAQWWPRTGPRAVMARPAVDRMTPLVFTIPGGSARLLRWLVRPEEPYDAGAPLARVRLAGGALWDLTARSRGTLDQILIEGGAPVATGEWLALVRQDPAHR
jgi:molecular chaperone DnaK (HSP70)